MKDNVAAAKAALSHLDIEDKDTAIKAASRATRPRGSWPS